MPASRVTSASPWHAVLVGFAQPGDRESAAAVHSALEFMIEEMTLISGGGKPLFHVSVISGCRQPQIIATAARDIEAADLLAASKPARRAKTPVKLSRLLEMAKSILEENPGRHQDHTPWVIVMSAGAADEDHAITAADALKTMDIAAGAPRIAVFDLSRTQSPALPAIASNAALYRTGASPESVAVALPGLVNIGGSARADMDMPTDKTIRTI
jgi:hypothetical protein